VITNWREGKPTYEFWNVMLNGLGGKCCGDEDMDK
jgi:hypothetical protein